jgi:NhaP-type Na+/H+ or K+/H+ antiporter
MEKQAKYLYEKMVDLKRFATIFLAAGVFFYLGIIIPSNQSNHLNLNIMSLASITFLVVSILLFTGSKKCRQKLLDHEEGQEYLMKK